MEDTQLRTTVAEIVDEYLTTNPQDHPGPALALVERMHNLLDELSEELDEEGQAATAPSSCSSVGASSSPVSNATRHEPLEDPGDDSAVSVAARASEDDEEDQDDSEDKDDGAPGAAGEDDEDDSTEDESSAVDDGDDEDEGQDASAGEDDDQSDNDDSGPGAGSERFEDTDPAKMLEEWLEEIGEEADDEIHSEAVERNIAVGQIAAGYRPSWDHRHLRTRKQAMDEQPAPDLVGKAAQISRELDELTIDFDSGWIRGEHTGRVNLLRAERAEEYGGDDDRVYDRWDEGVTDAVSLETVILLDTSPSMEWPPVGSSKLPIVEACRSLWVLHRGLMYEHEVVMTAYSYDSSERLLIDRGDRPGPMIPQYGVTPNTGTTLAPGLELAAHTLEVSNREIRPVFVITDGDFGDAPDVSRLLKVYPYPVVMIGINSDVERNWSAADNPAVLSAHNIKSAAQLVPVIKTVVLQLSQWRAVGLAGR